jgi:hypothetical protein
MCGCNKSMGIPKQAMRGSLQSPTRQFQQQQNNQIPFALGLTPPQTVPVSAADRRRIQQLNQAAIRRSLNR